MAIRSLRSVQLKPISGRRLSRFSWRSLIGLAPLLCCCDTQLSRWPDRRHGRHALILFADGYQPPSPGPRDMSEIAATRKGYWRPLRPFRRLRGFTSCLRKARLGSEAATQRWKSLSTEPGLKTLISVQVDCMIGLAELVILRRWTEDLAGAITSGPRATANSPCHGQYRVGAVSPSGRSAQIQRENFLRIPDAAQSMAAERLERPPPSEAAATNSAEARTMRPSGSHKASMRATSLIAGPMTVKSSRSVAPTLP